jgi:hypothetical protein
MPYVMVYTRIFLDELTKPMKDLSQIRRPQFRNWNVNYTTVTLVCSLGCINCCG